MSELRKEGKTVRSWVELSPMGHRHGSEEAEKARKTMNSGLQSQEWPCEHTVLKWDQKGGQGGWERQRGGGGKARGC